MTTIAADTLPETLQRLVDARLDTIDRMLLGRVDRQAIVREVEAQIHDQLLGRDAEALDREDVLAVLARLDPPEAYLPDDSIDGPTPRPARMTIRARSASTTHPTRVAHASGVVGLGSVGMILI